MNNLLLLHAQHDPDLEKDFGPFSYRPVRTEKRTPDRNRAQEELKHEERLRRRNKFTGGSGSLSLASPSHIREYISASTDTLFRHEQSL